MIRTWEWLFTYIFPNHIPLPTHFIWGRAQASQWSHPSHGCWLSFFLDTHSIELLSSFFLLTLVANTFKLWALLVDLLGLTAFFTFTAGAFTSFLIWSCAIMAAVVVLIIGCNCAGRSGWIPGAVVVVLIIGCTCTGRSEEGQFQYQVVAAALVNH